MEGHNDELEKLYGKFALVPVKVEASVFDWYAVRQHLVGLSGLFGDEMPYRRTVEALIEGIDKSMRAAAGSKELTAFVENEGCEVALFIRSAADSWWIIHSHLTAILKMFDDMLPYRDSVEHLDKAILEALEDNFDQASQYWDPWETWGLN